ncbi:hypothetical protein IAT38_005983 [Cryptococcus sp. DSM 104549]
MIDPSSTILLLHPATYDPAPFLSRLTQTSQENISETEPLTWTINNKYYSAEVSFQALPLGAGLDSGAGEGDSLSKYGDVDVVVYVFDGKAPNTLPPRLVQFMSNPRDIALAVRSLPADGGAASQDEGAGVGEEATELFDEIGMEYIDEVCPLTEEDDERPLEPLDIVRQTLQTHMWPGMARKPLHASSQLPASSSSTPSSSRASSPEHASFAVTFDPSAPVPLPRPEGLAGEAGEGEGERGPIEFPEPHELRAEIHAAEFARIDALDRLMRLAEESDGDEDALGDGFGAGRLGREPGEEEYARLDDWLDEDDGEFEPRELVEGEAGEGEKRGDWLEEDDRRFEPLEGDKNGEARGEKAEGQPEQGDAPPENKDKTDWLDKDDSSFDPVPPSRPSEPPTPAGFEDDFTAFQSAPPAARGAETLALDPTPLLLHLQSVRAELAGVANEDERRERAGREVVQMLSLLGMDVGEDDDFGLDEFGFDDIGMSGLGGLGGAGRGAGGI